MPFNTIMPGGVARPQGPMPMQAPQMNPMMGRAQMQRPMAPMMQRPMTPPQGMQRPQGLLPPLPPRGMRKQRLPMPTPGQQQQRPQGNPAQQQALARAALERLRGGLMQQPQLGPAMPPRPSGQPLLGILPQKSGLRSVLGV